MQLHADVRQQAGKISISRGGVGRIGIQHYQHLDLAAPHRIHQIRERLCLGDYRVGIDHRRADVSQRGINLMHGGMKFGSLVGAGQHDASASRGLQRRGNSHVAIAPAARRRPAAPARTAPAVASHVVPPAYGRRLWRRSVSAPAQPHAWSAVCRLARICAAHPPRHGRRRPVAARNSRKSPSSDTISSALSKFQWVSSGLPNAAFAPA